MVPALLHHEFRKNAYGLAPGFDGTFNSCRHHAAGTSAANQWPSRRGYQATRLTGHLQIFLINF